MGGKNLIKSNRKVILEGMRDGIPIGLGYLAVSFSLGIAAKAAGLNAFQSFLASLLCNASAGEYSGFTVIAADSSYFVIALATLVANARYLLMSCALSQRISKNTSIIHRLLLGFFVTDEFFGISISRSGKLNPFYTYGAILIGCPCWAFGSMLGTIAGNLLPYCQRTKRCTFRNVSCNHRSAVKKEQNTSRNCTCQLCGKFCICISSRHQSD